VTAQVIVSARRSVSAITLEHVLRPSSVAAGALSAVSSFSSSSETGVADTVEPYDPGSTA
jgi:hypothetical protein